VYQTSPIIPQCIRQPLSYLSVSNSPYHTSVYQTAPYHTSVYQTAPIIPQSIRQPPIIPQCIRQPPIIPQCIRQHRILQNNTISFMVFLNCWYCWNYWWSLLKHSFHNVALQRNSETRVNRTLNKQKTCPKWTFNFVQISWYLYKLNHCNLILMSIPDKNIGLMGVQFIQLRLPSSNVYNLHQNVTLLMSITYIRMSHF
jgi:hypothetical protein